MGAGEGGPVRGVLAGGAPRPRGAHRGGVEVSALPVCRHLRVAPTEERRVCPEERTTHTTRRAVGKQRIQPHRLSLVQPTNDCSMVLGFAVCLPIFEWLTNYNSSPEMYFNTYAGYLT